MLARSPQAIFCQVPGHFVRDLVHPFGVCSSDHHDAVILFQDNDVGVQSARINVSAVVFSPLHLVGGISQENVSGALRLLNPLCDPRLVGSKALIDKHIGIFGSQQPNRPGDLSTGLLRDLSPIRGPQL